METRRATAWIGAACLAATCLGVTAAAQKDDKNQNAKDDSKPKLSLKAQPPISMSPARIVLTAEITGGPNDSQDFYCPTIQWDWGDDTVSENTSDCDPYEAGKSEIKRRFTVEHVYKRSGMYRIAFRLKHHDKLVAAAVATVQVRPGLREGGD